MQLKSSDVVSDDCGWQIVDRIRFKNKDFQNAEPFQFIFIDGVLSEPYIINLGGFTLFLWRGGIGAGFENGRTKRKAANFLSVRKNISKDENINDLLKSISECLSSFGKVVYVDQDNEVVEKLRQEELNFAIELAKGSEGKAADRILVIVLDGPIPPYKELYEQQIRICGLVKNICCWYGYSEEDFVEFHKGEVSDILKLEKNGALKFAFFMKVADNKWVGEESPPVIRIEFTLCEDIIGFANVLKNKILKSVSLIGDRAPKNITPVRVLERLLREREDSGKFILRKIQVILKSFNSNIKGLVR